MQSHPSNTTPCVAAPVFAEQYIAGAYRICRVTADSIWLEFRADGTENTHLPKQYGLENNEEHILHDGYVTGEYIRMPNPHSSSSSSSGLSSSSNSCFVVKVARRFNTPTMSTTILRHVPVHDNAKHNSSFALDLSITKESRTKPAAKQRGRKSTAVIHRSPPRGLSRCLHCTMEKSSILTCERCSTPACYDCRQKNRCCKTVETCTRCSVTNKSVKRCAICDIMVCSGCRQEDVCILCFKSTTTLTHSSLLSCSTPILQETTTQEEKYECLDAKPNSSTDLQKPRIKRKIFVSDTDQTEEEEDDMKFEHKTHDVFITSQHRIKSSGTNSNHQLQKKLQTTSCTLPESAIDVEDSDAEEKTNEMMVNDDGEDDKACEIPLERKHLLNMLNIQDRDIEIQLKILTASSNLSSSSTAPATTTRPNTKDDSVWTFRSVEGKLLVDRHPDDRDLLSIPDSCPSRSCILSDNEDNVHHPNHSLHLFDANGVETDDIVHATYGVLVQSGIVISISTKDLFFAFYGETSSDGKPSLGFAPAQAVRFLQDEQKRVSVEWNFLSTTEDFCEAEATVDDLVENCLLHELPIECTLAMSAHVPMAVKVALAPAYRSTLHEWEKRYNPNWLDRHSQERLLRRANAYPSIHDGLELYYVRARWIWRTAFGRYVMEDFIKIIGSFGYRSQTDMFALLQEVSCRDTEGVFCVQEVDRGDALVDGQCDACLLKRTLSHHYTTQQSPSAVKKIGRECRAKLRYVFDIIQLLLLFRQNPWNPMAVSQLHTDLLSTREAYHLANHRFER